MTLFQTPERTGTINGVPGRFYAISASDADGETFINQTWKSERRPAQGYGHAAFIVVTIRYDDGCKNGHNTFSITGEVSTEHRMRVGADWIAGGCIHEEIAAAFPELAPLIRWHLTSSDGPMHYIANTVFLASDRDHNGLRAGEARQIVNGRTGLPCWVLQTVNGDAVHSIEKYFDGHEADGLPAVPSLKWAPMLRVGEGKARDLDGARRVAVWPDATDAELLVEPDSLRSALAARLPRLLEQFRTDIEAAGLQWSPATYQAPRNVEKA